jgi:hypothetical protein
MVLMGYTRGTQAALKRVAFLQPGFRGVDVPRARATQAPKGASVGPHMVPSNRMPFSDRLWKFRPCPLWQIALTCAKALTHRSLCQAVRSWQAVLHIAQSVSVEPHQGQGTRWRLGFAGPASLTLSGFNDQMESSGDAANEVPSGHPLPGADSDPC